MRYLLLIRHSQSHPEPEIPAKNWHLSEEGRRRCNDMAPKVAAYAPQKIVASREPKATETGQLIAEALQIPFSTAENLHEHERESLPFTTQEDFNASVKRLFDYPDQLVMGEETAEQASVRFDAAVQSVLRENPGNIAIASHGTVMSLFTAKHANIDALSIWKRLGMPAMLVFSVPEMELMEIIEGVTE